MLVICFIFALKLSIPFIWWYYYLCEFCSFAEWHCKNCVLRTQFPEDRQSYKVVTLREQGVKRNQNQPLAKKWVRNFGKRLWPTFFESFFLHFFYHFSFPSLQSSMIWSLSVTDKNHRVDRRRFCRGGCGFARIGLWWCRDVWYGQWSPQTPP